MIVGLRECLATALGPAEEKVTSDGVGPSAMDRMWCTWGGLPVAGGMSQVEQATTSVCRMST